MIIRFLINQFMFVVNEFNKQFFPSKDQLVVQKWYDDGGDFKLRFNYDIFEDSIVLDVGGYNGQWASDLFSRYKCHIFVFEPVRIFAELIQTRFKKNDFITVFPIGLGGSSRLELIHLSGTGSSIFGTSTNCEEIEIIDVKVWIEKQNIKKIALIKINIEGGEYELLARLIETDLIKICDNIQVQFHNISHDSREKMEKIQEKLQITHKMTYQYEFVWENWEIKNKNQ